MEALKDKLNQLLKQRDTALQERDAIKQQCTKAIRQWNLIIQQHNDLKEILKQKEFEHKKTMKELQSVIANNLEINEALCKERITRHNTFQEYRLVMSERDIVYNDIEKLTTDLFIQNNKNKLLKKEIKDLKDEIKPLKWQVECFKRELSTIIRDRDETLQKCNNYQQKYDEIITKNEDQSYHKSQLSYDISREEQNQNFLQEKTASLSLFDSCHNKPIYNLDEANQEIEYLRKSIYQNHTEANKLQTEATISEKRRDWAFGERDKIMLEREELRRLSNYLRIQLNETIRFLALVLNDIEDKTHRINNHVIENKETMEAQLEKDIRLLQLQIIDFQRENSAIHLRNKDTEIFIIELDFSDSNDDIGIGLLGGKDEPLYLNDNAIYISSINKESLAARKLRVNDCILRVNGIDCSLISKQLVLENMRTFSRATLVVRRKKPVSPSKSLFTICLQGNKYDHGISLESGIYINKIIPGSVAAKDGNLDVDDRVLSINNVSLNNVNNAREAMSLLNESANVLTISTSKCTQCDKYCSSGHNHNDFNKFLNSASQTDSPASSTHQETYLMLPYFQSRQVMQGVLEKPQRNLSLINNNDISEHDQGGVPGSVNDGLKSHSESTVTHNFITTI